jgi:O-antigen biosynthesis protein
LALPQPDCSKESSYKPYKIVVIGALGPHKGSGLLVEIAANVRKNRLPIEFTLVGYSDRDEQLTAQGVQITGKYQERDLHMLLAKQKTDICFFPAVWPETFSYTLSEVMRAGFYPIAFDIGAIASRIKASGIGHLLPLELMLDPEAVAHELHSLLPKLQGTSVIYEASTYDDVIKNYYEL